MLSMNVGNPCYKQTKDKDSESLYMNLKISTMHLISLLSSILMQRARHEWESMKAISEGMILCEVTK